jgi:hypothetical protein
MPSLRAQRIAAALLRVRCGTGARSRGQRSTLGCMSDTAYEVRCERCQTSFAPGTKQCIHCGGAIGGRRLLAFDAFSTGGAEPPDASERLPGVPDAQPSLAGIVRIAMIALVVVSAIARACMDGN